MPVFQFIPALYKRVSNLYPQAGLTKDFVREWKITRTRQASFLLFDAT